MQLESADLPLTINGVTLQESDLPSDVTLPTDTHDMTWSDSDLPADSDVETITGKGVADYNTSDKSNWMSDAIARHLRINTPTPPNSETAFEKINNYFIEKEGGTDKGLDRVETLLSGGRGKLIDRAIAQENYDIAKNRIKKHNDITDQEESDLIDILRGER